MSKLMVFTGNANPELAKLVVERLDLSLGEATVGKFSDGEITVEINENVRGKDVFILQPTCAPTNDNLMEMLLMADGLRRASASRITAVVPYFGYARQDRRPRSARVPISARAVADMMSGSGIDRVLTVDLHADQIQGFFDIPVDNVYGSPILLDDMERQNFEDLDETVWDKVMSVNVKGVWQMCRAMTPLLKASGAGAIINVASATVFSGSPQWMHYVASKGAVIAMTRSMARELGDANIRANVIAPGFTLTEASLDLIENAENYGVTRGALKRSADASDMVGGALYLASDLAGFVTGQTLIIDGGRQFI